MANPRVTLAGIPLERASTITTAEDHLWGTARNKLAGGGTRKALTIIDNHRRVTAGAGKLEPTATANNINYAIAIYIGLSQAFMLQATCPPVDRGQWPVSRVAWVRGNLRQEKGAGTLIPKDQLSLAIPIKVTE